MRINVYLFAYNWTYSELLSTYIERAETDSSSVDLRMINNYIYWYSISKWPVAVTGMIFNKDHKHMVLKTSLLPIILTGIVNEQQCTLNSLSWQLWCCAVGHMQMVIDQLGNTCLVLCCSVNFSSLSNGYCYNTHMLSVKVISLQQYH